MGENNHITNNKDVLMNSDSEQKMNGHVGNEQILYLSEAESETRQNKAVQDEVGLSKAKQNLQHNVQAETWKEWSGDKLQYRIGLDIGITSVGWAVLENGINDEPRRIVDLGVRIFEAAEIPKTGESLAMPRRNARTTRRRLRRRRHRLDRIKWLLEKEGIIQIDSFMERYHMNNLPCVYELRCKALEKKLTKEEFAQILIYIAKHRGFKSTRKAETKEKEGGAVLSATKENKRIMEEKGYRTVGEMIYKDEAFTTNAPWTANGKLFTPRNKQEDYRHTILRELLAEEVKTIFEMQRKLGNDFATEELEGAYLEIMLSQRSFDEGPGNQPDGSPSPYGGNLIDRMVGKCTFEKGEQRGAKATYTAERFVLLQKINHTVLITDSGNTMEFTPQQRETLVAYAYEKKELKYSDVRKKLNLPENVYFKGLNYGSKKANKENDLQNRMQSKEKSDSKEVEKAKFVSMQWFYQIQKARGIKPQEITGDSEKDLIDNVGTILTKFKSDEGRRRELCKLHLDLQEVENLLELNPSKFQHLSLKAMKKVIPYLEQGQIYNVACENAGYNFKADGDEKRMTLLSGEILKELLEDIPNPVVKRAISQTVKVLNAIIRKYGSPQAIHIELAREMSKNFQERNKIQKQYQDNQNNNERVKNQIKEYGVSNPTGQDILKFRLWQEQNETCMYTGNHIPLERLFNNDDYEIDHIIPYSISFDDSFKNKVLVESGANREKGNRIPAEYFGVETERWHKFQVLVDTQVHDYKKRQYLLKEKLTKEDRSGFKERNLTDTKYITTAVMNLIRKNLAFAPFSDEKKKKRVYAVNGAITSYLRKRWGLMQKDRSTDRHHAMDAVVVACCTDGMIQKISRNIQGRELAFAYGLKYVDVETGEILDRGMSREAWDEAFGVRIPLPWAWFRDELEIRMSDNPMYFEKEFLKWGYPINKEVKPMFVSRMPNHKTAGQGHKETIRSARHFEEKGIVLSKTDIKLLKLDKDGEIKDYYAPEDDLRLYNALKKQLQFYGGDGKKAFAEPFYKPKADGTRGPLVKKVKVIAKQTSGVLLGYETKVNKDKTLCHRAGGIAENGTMVRIDVFKENGKYYFVPIYTSDTRKEILPNRAATAKKTFSEWRVMKEENFVFSLYSRDLIRIKGKRPIKVKNFDGSIEEKEEILAYYTGADINSAVIAGKAHDSSFEFRGLGIQSLEIFEKYNVDVLGNISKIKCETRMPFTHKR